MRFRIIWIPPSRSLIYLIHAVYFPKENERRAAATRSRPREPAARRSCTTARRSGSPKTRWRGSGCEHWKRRQLEDVQKTAQATATRAPPSLYASGVALSQPTRKAFRASRSFGRPVTALPELREAVA